MTLEFIYPADRELLDAFDFYETQLSGLGAQFIDDFNRTIKLILKYPDLWRLVGKHTRKALLKRFPYLMLYIVEDQKILITCIAHQHRGPEYFIERMV